MRTSGLTAPLVVDGAINGAVFLAYVQQHLAPTLCRGDVVVMDNLGAHKVAGVAAAIEARGARVEYLPPYSPDLNPIERAFSKLKALLRKAAKRTVEELWDYLGEVLDEFKPQECRNYLASEQHTTTRARLLVQRVVEALLAGVLRRDEIL